MPTVLSMPLASIGMFLRVSLRSGPMSRASVRNPSISRPCSPDLSKGRETQAGLDRNHGDH